MSRVADRRHRPARPRAPRPSMPPAHNSPAQRVLREMELWWPAFAGGALTPDADHAPPLRPGERFAVELPAVRTAGLGLPVTAGALCATDCRAIITTEWSRSQREWAHQDLCAVDALGNWGGVALTRADGDTELIVSAAPEPPTWHDATAWLKVEAAFAAATGRLDDWMGRLPQRLALAAEA